MNLERLVNNRKFWFYSLLSLLIIFLSIRVVFQMLVPEVLLIAILVGMALVGGRDEILAVCVCLVPLYTVVAYYYVLAFCICVYVVKYPEDIKIDFSITPILLIVLWELFHCFVGSIDPKAVLAAILLYLFLGFLLSLRNISVNYGFIIRCFALIVFAMAFFLFVQLLIRSNFNITLSFLTMHRLGVVADESSEMTSVLNPNTLGILSVLAVSGLIQLQYVHKQKNHADIALIILLLVLGTLTMSRTYIVCLLIMVVLFLFSIKRDLKTKLKWIGSVIAIVIVAISILAIFLPVVLETFVLRFQVEDITSGRNDLLLLFNDFIFSSAEIFLWGIGLLDFGNKITITYAVSNIVPHNGIQEILIAWGIPGLIMVALLIWMFVSRSRQENRNQSLTNFIPLVILLAKVQVGQWITSTYTMLAFTIIYLSLCANFEPKSNTLFDLDS